MGWTKEERAEYMKKYRAKNRERLNENQRYWRRHNKEEQAVASRERMKKWREENREQYNAYHREYYRNNRDKWSAYQREYVQKGKGRNDTRKCY